MTTRKKLANEHILHASSPKADAEITGKESAKVWGETISRYFDALQVKNPILKEELKKRMVPHSIYLANLDENGEYHGPTTGVAETRQESEGPRQ
jgi:hypothetical protein